MNRKTALITGASGKIGFAIARNIAKLSGFRVILVGRDEAGLEDACQRINNDTGNADADYMLADLSLRDDIRALARTWDGPLHILINNAAACPQSKTLNREGLEMQFATNILGYYRMIKAFEPILTTSAPARIVNVASYWAGDLDMDDLEFRRRYYNNNTAYRQSKQADRMLSAAFAKKFIDQGITVNACHPGDVNSKLSNSLGFGGHESPDQGAATPVWLATAEEVEAVSGKYFENKSVQACRFSADIKACMKLADICSRY